MLQYSRRKRTDHIPIRQTFELGKFISTAGKSIINLVKLLSLVEKYVHGNAFPRVIQKYTKFENFA